MGVGQKAVVTNPLEARRQGMDKEATDELVGVQRHVPDAIAMPVILPLKGDLIVVKRLETLIADRHTMRVARQIRQHRFRSGEGRLGIDEPIPCFPMA